MLPKIQLGAGSSSTNGDVQGSFGEIRDVDFNTASPYAAVGYRLNIGQQIHQTLAARRKVAAAAWETLDQRQRLLYRVTELYQQLVLAKMGTHVAEQLVSDSEEFRKIAHDRETGGISPGSETQRAHVKLAVANQQLAQVKGLHREKSARLAAVLDLYPTVILDPEGDQASPKQLVWRQPESAPGRPDVAAAAEARKATTHAASAAKWDLLAPQLGIEYRESGIGDSFSRLNGLQNYGAFLLWDLSFSKLGALRERHAETKAAQLRLNRALRNARRDIEISKSDMQTAAEQIPFAQSAVTAATENLKLTQARYRASKAISLEVFDVQDKLAESRIQLGQSVVNFNLSQAGLFAALGALDEKVILNAR